MYWILISGFILAGCDKDKDAIPECNVENPIEELSWLKDVKNSLTNCSCQISMGMQSGSTNPERMIFFFSEAEPVNNIYTCSE